MFYLSKRAAVAEDEVQKLMSFVLPGTPFQGKVFSVGGYERDKLLGKESKDLDIVVEIKGGSEQLAKYMKSIFPEEISTPYQLGAGYPIWHISFKENITHNGKTFNTAGAEIDIADTQKETYPDPTSRQRETQFATIEEDVERRDFTANMLLRDLSNNEIVDLTGVSKADIEKGILRGHPKVSPDKMFSEDPLRMMRLVRFQVKYGWDVPLSMLKAVKRNAEQIQKISWERIQDELVKVMKLGKTNDAIRLMKTTGLLEYILPEIYGLIGVEHDKRGHEEGDAYKHTLMVLSKAPPTLNGQLAALLHDVGKPQTQQFMENKISFYGHEKVGGEIAEAIMRRLKFDAKTIKMVKHLVENHMKPHHLKDATEKSLRKFIRTVGKETIEDLLDLAEADSLGKLPPDNYVPELREKIKSLDVGEMSKEKAILDGDEIIDLLKVKRGPIVGQVKRFLQDLEDEYLSNKMILTKEKAKEEVLRNFKQQELDDSNRYLILLVGIPGAGKSTYIKENLSDATIISPDHFIGYTKEDPWTPEKVSNAWKKSDDLLLEAIKRGDKKIVFDATFVNPKVRGKYINIAKRFGLTPVAIHCNVPLDQALKRNSQRPEFRKVPEETLIRMYKNLVNPSESEGFKEVVDYDSSEKE